MGSKRILSRRHLLIGAGAAGGALVLGFVLGPMVGERRRRGAIRAEAEGSGVFRPNAWLAIHPDGRIVFALDRVEMGQGTYTSHPMLIAEELEVDPAAIEVEFAVADRRYDHPEFMIQATGGSTSVRTSWTTLLKAGAVAREMLRAAAAEEWGVPIGQCTASNGSIAHAPSGRSLAYGALAKLAAAQAIPDPPLKSESTFTRIGHPLPRKDALAKSTGRAQFGIDVLLPGQLKAVVLRPPVLGAQVAGFDAGRAAGMPGVKAVFQVPSGVAIVAESYWKARTAAKEVAVRWEGGKTALDTVTLGAELKALTDAPGKSVRDDGDAMAALDNAAQGGKIVEAAYEAPHLAHAPMEPMNCTARVKDGRCEIWAPTQAQGPARELVAEALGIPRENVTVHTTFLGGGFGRRLVQDFVVEAAHVASQVDAPVQVIWSREEDTAHGIFRPQVRHALRAALDASGKPVAWLHRIAAPSLLSEVLPKWLPAMTPDFVPGGMDRGLADFAGGAFAKGWVPDDTSTEGASDTPYGIPNLRVELAVHNPGVPIGFWRSVGHSHTAFAVESFIDELALTAGQDPYRFRRELLKEAPRHLAVLDAAAEHAGWTQPPPAGRFRGIAVHKSFFTYVAQVAEVSVQDGVVQVHRVVCAVDCGRVVNPAIVEAQMQSGIVFGLSAALKQRISFKGGRVEQGNFHEFRMLRMREMPRVEVVILPSEEEPTGTGEPAVPPIAAAVANAIAAATGKRPRHLPFEDGALSPG